VTEAATPTPSPEPGESSVAEASTPAKSTVRNLLEWVAVVVGAVVIAVIVRTFLLQTFWIPSPSMAPTLVENDRVLVNKLAYRLHDINRGDVIVFERPPNEPADERIKDLIKRVVALPGERVSVIDGQVRIDGRLLEEPYVRGVETVIGDCPTTNVPGIDTEEGFLVPEGTVLVMGDNRVNSRDGRCFGPIDEDLVVGRAFFIMWPPSHAGGL
jgi:signal peptidase I